jgi:hypothetical protein
MKTSANLDSGVADAALAALAGTGKPYVQIGGLWIYGDNTSISEESPIKSPALAAWNDPIERWILNASEMRAVVLVSGVADEDGGGRIPGALLGSPRDEDPGRATGSAGNRCAKGRAGRGPLEI